MCSKVMSLACSSYPRCRTGVTTGSRSPVTQRIGISARISPAVEVELGVRLRPPIVATDPAIHPAQVTLLRSADQARADAGSGQRVLVEESGSVAEPGGVELDPGRDRVEAGKARNALGVE
jgi:hypothetical protein